MKTSKIRNYVYDRENGKCERKECRKFHNKDSKTYEIHHINFKSQYNGIDRDEPWNLALLCTMCHRLGQYAVHNGNTKLDQFLKTISNIRKPHKLRQGGKHSDLIQLSEKRKQIYKKKIESFKKNNNGLSPYQVAYRKLKINTSI